VPIVGCDSRIWSHQQLVDFGARSGAVIPVEFVWAIWLATRQAAYAGVGEVPYPADNYHDKPGSRGRRPGNKSARPQSGGRADLRDLQRGPLSAFLERQQLRAVSEHFHTTRRCSSKTCKAHRFLAILMRWCSRHSLQTQPWTYAALVPCVTSFLRAAVRAVSNFSDHSCRSWQAQTPGWKSGQGHVAPPGMAGRHRSR
jgi:hypothetical protein